MYLNMFNENYSYSKYFQKQRFENNLPGNKKGRSILTSLRYNYSTLKLQMNQPGGKLRLKLFRLQFLLYFFRVRSKAFRCNPCRTNI